MLISSQAAIAAAIGIMLPIFIYLAKEGETNIAPRGGHNQAWMTPGRRRKDMETGKAFLLFGSGGRTMVPIEQSGLRLGQVVSYGDQANPKQKAVVVEVEGSIYGQKVVFVEDYHVSQVSVTTLDGLGGWQYEDDPDFSAKGCAFLMQRSQEAVIYPEKTRKEAA